MLLVVRLGKGSRPVYLKEVVMVQTFGTVMHPVIPPTFTLSGRTVSCEAYYVWVDGCNGDVCTYTMSVNTHRRFTILCRLFFL